MTVQEKLGILYAWTECSVCQIALLMDVAGKAIKLN